MVLDPPSKYGKTHYAHKDDKDLAQDRPFVPPPAILPPEMMMPCWTVFQDELVNATPAADCDAVTMQVGGTETVAPLVCVCLSRGQPWGEAGELYTKGVMACQGPPETHPCGVLTCIVTTQERR